MELESVKGLGSAKADALRAAGITSLVKLAEADLRRVGPIGGVSSDPFQKYKVQARRILDREGIRYRKAPYGTTRAAPKTPNRPTAPVAPVPVARPPEPPRRRGLLGRLLGR